MAYKDKTFYERVILRQAEMEDERLEADTSRETIVEYFRPDITIYSSENSAETGKFLHDDIAETTGGWSALTMANGFQSAMVGPTIKWLRNSFGQMNLRGNDALNAFLQRCDDYMLEQVFRKSNFYETIGSQTLDGITIGSPVMLMEENEATGAIICKLPHYKESFLKRDWFGNDIAYHRLFEVNAMNLEMFFGTENLSPEVVQKLESGDHKTKTKVLMVIYHEDDPIFENLPEYRGQKPPNSNLTYKHKHLPGKSWYLYYFLYDCEDKRFQGALPAGTPGYWYKPFNAWHYFRNPHDTYARTPAWFAIYDEKAGNAAWTAGYELMEKMARPPMVGLKEMKSRVKAAPGKFTWALSDREYDRAPKTLSEQTQYPNYMDFLDRIDSKRRRHFHIDLFRMLDEFHKEHKQPPTAYEVAQMIAEKNAQIGPAIESYDRGLLGAAYDRFLEIEIRSGRFFRQTDPPPEIMETDGRLVPRFTGPLAQAQRLSVMMRRVTDNMSMVQPILEMWPDARYKIKEDKLVERILEEGEFFQECIRTEEEYNEYMEMINAMRNREAQLAELSVVADAVPKLQKSSEEGSPMEILEG